MRSILTRQELDAWRGFRFMVEETSQSVSRALAAATGMSGGQFGILSLLVEAPLHSMRQQALADAMRWDRTRLSHVITRMETRAWIKRTRTSQRLTLVSLTQLGRKEQHSAAPILARIVEEHFLSRLTQAQLDTLQEIRKALQVAGPP